MLKRILTGVGTAVLVVALPAGAQAQMPEPPEGREATISGTVIDLSCRFRHNLTGESHRMCAQVCADQGVPLAILSSDGKLYMPVTDGMPGETQNERLKEFAEQQVRIRGTVYDAGGANAIVINQIRKS